MVTRLTFSRHVLKSPFPSLQTVNFSIRGCFLSILGVQYDSGCFKPTVANVLNALGVDIPHCDHVLVTWDTPGFRRIRDSGFYF